MTDFSTMDKTQLRAYLIDHPQDKLAFQAFVDRYTSEADSKIYSMAESLEEMQEIDNLIQQKVTQAKSS
ncbi:MAG: hypothetical protein AAFW67_08075 [Cyanobacteria bacterium J06638_38]